MPETGAKSLPDIISAAAKSPLGLVALTVCALAIIAIIFFRDESYRVKLGVFAALLVGASAFVIALLDNRSPVVSEVTLEIPDDYPAIGKPIHLLAHVKAEAGASQSVIWSSTNSRVASVSPSGEVVVDSVGSTTITATAPGVRNVSASVILVALPGQMPASLPAAARPRATDSLIPFRVDLGAPQLVATLRRGTRFKSVGLRGEWKAQPGDACHDVAGFVATDSSSGRYAAIRIHLLPAGQKPTDATALDYRGAPYSIPTIRDSMSVYVEISDAGPRDNVTCTGPVYAVLHP